LLKLINFLLINSILNVSGFLGGGHLKGACREIVLILNGKNYL